MVAQYTKLTSGRAEITVAPEGNLIMRIAVMGSGAVGGYFGAKLAAAGNDVAFVARGRHLAALLANGLRVKSPNGDVFVRQARFSDAPERVGEVDLILFCVKSYDTESAARAIAPMVSDATQILSLQNGIDNPDKLARFYGLTKVFPAVVYVGAQLSAPGVITHSTGGKIIFGQMDGAIADAAKTLAQSLNAAGIPSETNSQIRQVQWTKLLWNSSFCAISCLTRSSTKEIVEAAALTKLALDCMNEVRAAARLADIELAEKLCEDTIEFSRTLGSFKPSMLQDLEAHKPLEYEAFNGVVVKRLSVQGRTAPINQAFYAMLKFLDERIREEAGR